MPILFLLSLETGGQSGQVGEALRINGFRRPLTKNTMWAQVGRWAQNGTCPLGSAHLPTLGKCRWARFFARIPLNSKASPTCPLRPPVLNRLLKQFKAESWSCPMWTVKINKSMPERLATLATPATSRAHQRFSAVATFPVSPLWKNETGDGKSVDSQGLSPLSPVSPVHGAMTQVIFSGGDE